MALNVTHEELFMMIGVRNVENAKLQQRVTDLEAEIASKDALIAELKKRPEPPAPEG